MPCKQSPFGYPLLENPLSELNGKRQEQEVKVEEILSDGSFECYSEDMKRTIKDSIAFSTISKTNGRKGQELFNRY